MNIFFALVLGIVTSVTGYFGYTQLSTDESVGAALFTFQSAQLADNPQNNYILSTDGTNNSWIVNSGGGGSSLHVDGGGFVYPQTGDYHSAPKYVATSTTEASTFVNASTTQLTNSGLSWFNGTSTWASGIHPIMHGIYALDSSGLHLHSNNGTEVAYFGAGGAANVTFKGALNFSGVTTDITTGTNESLSIAPNGTGDFFVNTDDLYVDTSTGNVGIGTTTPNVPLHIGGASNTALAGTKLLVVSDSVSPGGMEVRNTNNSAFSDARIASIASDGSYVVVGQPAPVNALTLFGQTRGQTSFVFNFAGSEGGAARNLAIGTFDNKDVVLGTNNTERIRITNAGNVGIGDSSPAALLTVGAGDLFQVNSSGAIAAITGLSGATGAYDFGGSSSFEITNGTNPTIDANGEIGINTSTSSIRFYSGAEYQIKPEFPVFGVTFASSSLEYDGAFGASGTTTETRTGLKYPVTVTEIYCKTDTGSVKLRIGDGTNWSQTLSCTTSGATQSSPTNNTFIAREDIQIQVGTSASSPNKIYLDVTGRWTTD